MLFRRFPRKAITSIAWEARTSTNGGGSRTNQLIRLKAVEIVRSVAQNLLTALERNKIDGIAREVHRSIRTQGKSGRPMEFRILEHGLNVTVGPHARDRRVF